MVRRIFSMALMLWLPAAVGLSSEAQDLPIFLRVSLREGEVIYQRSNLEYWVDLAVNAPVLAGESIWVGENGRVELESDRGDLLRMGEESIIELVAIGRDEPADIVIRLHRGLATILTAGSFRVETPLFDLQASAQSVLRLEVDPGRFSRVVVFEGRPEIEYEAGQLFGRRGEVLTFPSSDLERYFLASNYAEDEWDQWNWQRNDYLAADNGESRQSSVDGWREADLEHHGEWHWVERYGNVWRPHEDPDWVPFRKGQWVWYDALGWTWISHEAWGWLPYHYGRWALVDGLGWSWVPGGQQERWCPGAVTWVEGPQWFGWIPLAPQEPWYGRQGPSVSVFRSRNYRHVSGFSYIARDSLIRGIRSPSLRRPRSPSAGGRVLFGQPRVRPRPVARVLQTPAYSGRKFTNEDLAGRRSLRSRTKPYRSDSPPSSQSRALLTDTGGSSPSPISDSSPGSGLRLMTTYSGKPGRSTSPGTTVSQKSRSRTRLRATRSSPTTVPGFPRGRQGPPVTRHPGRFRVSPSGRAKAGQQQTRNGGRPVSLRTQDAGVGPAGAKARSSEVRSTSRSSTSPGNSSPQQELGRTKH